MNTRALMLLSASALMLGGTMVGCAAGAGHLASASDRLPAGKAADRAHQALAQGKPEAAVRYAEAAAAADPQTAELRVLLGRSYLKAGRLASARQAFADALALTPGNGQAALNLALAQTGLGDWAGARATLAQHVTTILAADRGLALAVAGDPNGAVQLLMVAARTPGADIKTRQNLALAFALAGHWQEARAVAGMDLAPAEVDKRLEQWAAFAHPAKASDQVAALLGVRIVDDAGQPAGLTLALAAPVSAAPVVVAAAEPVATPTPSVVEAKPVAVPTPVPAAEVKPAPAMPASQEPQYAAPREIVQPLPSASSHARAAVAAPVATTPKAAAPSAKGDWFVQIGAYGNAGVARDGWMRVVRRDAAFRAFSPREMTFAARSGKVHRLSVGGLTRVAADSLCHGYRARGGACFVRHGSDQLASWVRRDVQLASR